VIKAISFIVLTQFFHFNELKILRQPGYFIHVFKLNQQYFFTVYWHSSKYLYLCSAEERNSYRFETTWGWV